MIDDPRPIIASALCSPASVNGLSPCAPLSMERQDKRVDLHHKKAIHIRSFGRTGVTRDDNVASSMAERCGHEPVRTLKFVRGPPGYDIRPCIFVCKEPRWRIRTVQSFQGNKTSGMNSLTWSLTERSTAVSIEFLTESNRFEHSARRSWSTISLRRPSKRT